MKNVPCQLTEELEILRVIFGSTYEQFEMSNSREMLINSQVKFTKK